MMNAQFEELSEEFTQRAEKIGLYSKSCFIIPQGDDVDKDAIESNDLREMLDNGDVQLVMVVTFTAGDLAFSDRVQHPEMFDLDAQFNAMMPTSEEMSKDKLREIASKADETTMSKSDFLDAFFSDEEE